MIPWWWKWVALLLLLIAAGIGLRIWEARLRAEGRVQGKAEVQKLWNADAARRIQANTDTVMLWDKTRQLAEQRERERDAAQQQLLAKSQERVHALPALVAAVRIPAVAVNILRDAITASDSTTAATAAARTVSPPAAVATDSNLGDLTEWGIQMIAVCTTYLDVAKGWQKWYGELQKAQTFSP